MVLVFRTAVAFIACDYSVTLPKYCLVVGMCEIVRQFVKAEKIGQ